MKKYTKIFVIAVFMGCSASSNIPTDFSITYNSKNALMDWELNISVNSESLKLDYKDKQNNISGNGIYSITESESRNIYNYMKSSGFLKMKAPEGERIVDMPTQNLNGTFNGKSNYIEFGTVKELPETLAKLKQMLFDLTSKYNSKWKNDLGL